MRLAIRGYKAKTLVFDERHELEDALDMLLPKLVERHVKLLGDEPHMIEIEFLDEPDPLKRFFRFGTDPTGMVIPIEIGPSW